MLPSLAGKRILFVFNALHLGGAERQALLLARGLQEDYRACVEFWTFVGGGRASELCDVYGIPWRMVPFRWAYNKAERVANMGRLAWRFRAARPAIILPYTMLPNIVCGLTWRGSGAKVCVWNQRDEGRDRFHPTIERWATRLTPWYISNSQHGADFLTQTVGVAPDRVRVIYNGIVLSKPEIDRATWRARLGIGETDLLVCMVANLTHYKDHATLLRAWQHVVERAREQNLCTLLLLAGRFDDATDSLKALAYDLDLGRSVRFWGRVDDIPGLLKAVDLAVFSSRLEGVPNGLLECMAAGLPVVATDIPGIREALGREALPYLAPIGDADALARRIWEQLSSPDLRITLGHSNAARVSEIFSPHAMIENTARFLATLLR